MLKTIYYYLLIAKSRLFDRSYYLKTNPDVKQAGVDPLLHFIQNGWKEGRNPSPSFNINEYLFSNPDVVNINPLIHYIKHGINEGRSLFLRGVEEQESRFFDLSSQHARNETLEFNTSNPPSKIDFIILPTIDWNYRFQRPQQIATHLAALGHRIFYVLTGFSQDKFPSVYRIKNNIFLVRLSTKDPNLIFNTFLSQQTALDLAGSIKIIKDHFLIDSAIMKVDLPYWTRLAAHLKNNFGWKLIYDCMDLHTSFSNSSKYAEKDETEILQESNLVLASSSYLYEHVIEKNKNTILFPNATDYDHFNQKKSNNSDNQLSHFSSPIIGYYGAIADWFDTDLIAKLARKHQEWTFVLIGDTYLADLEPIKDLKNVYLLGEKPYSEIPGYLWSFDVCIIPFKKTPLTDATNPVKLFEYLSAGKPVVSTHLKEISRYEDYVKLAKTVDEWDSAIKACLNEEKTPELLRKRYAFAMANTWEKRVLELLPHIYKLFL